MLCNFATPEDRELIAPGTNVGPQRGIRILLAIIRMLVGGDCTQEEHGAKKQDATQSWES
jgi:hypothetical protein